MTVEANMAAGRRSLPLDFFDQVIILGAALNLNLVTHRDRSGQPTELSVPYGRPGDPVWGYRVKRVQGEVWAEAVGEKPGRCRLTPDQRRRLEALCDGLAAGRSRRRSSREGPHQLVICT